jgi:D-lactate dehydrogenase
MKVSVFEVERQERAAFARLEAGLMEPVERPRRVNFSLKGFSGFDMREKPRGVTGTGNIGRCVIDMAAGFRMEGTASDITPARVLAERPGFRYTSLSELFSTSDVFSPHIPESPSAFNFLSAPQFEMMKDGAVLVSTARGSLHALPASGPQGGLRRVSASKTVDMAMVSSLWDPMTAI